LTPFAAAAALMSCLRTLQTNWRQRVNDALDEENIEDDRLRLIFTCCHPAWRKRRQIALTLREVCGLKTEEIASAFLIPAPTLGATHRPRQGQKSRKPASLRECRRQTNFQNVLGSVLHVIYLMFNEGYFATSGAALTRPELSQEAIRLARLLLELFPIPK